MGRKQELPALLGALDRAVGWTKDTFHRDHGYPEPLSASSRLAEVIEVVPETGWTAPNVVGLLAGAPTFGAVLEAFDSYAAAWAVFAAL